MNAAFFTHAPHALLVLLAALLALPAQAGLAIQQWQAKSGAKVLFVENRDLPMLDVAVHFDAGSRRDVPDKAGRASLTLHMLQMGAGGLSDDAIARRLADVGAQLGPSFDRDRAGLSLRTLSSARERDQALAVLAAVLQSPDFDDKVLEREKARVIAGIKEGETLPGTIADKLFYRTIYGNHPYGLPVSGEVETVQKLTRDDLMAFYRTHYAATGAVVTMIGDVSRAEAEAIAEQLTGQLPRESAPPAPPAVAPLADGVVKRIAHPATQAHIMIGAPAMRRADPDFFALHVGNYILGGGGFDSRMLIEIRQKRGLAYSAYSYFAPMRQEGPFLIGLQTKKEDAETALRVAQETLARFLDQGPSAAELTQAKNNLILGFPLRIDSNRKILQQLGVIGFYDLPADYLDQYTRNVAAVSAAQIRDAFRRHVDPARLAVVMVGAPDAAPPTGR